MKEKFLIYKFKITEFILAQKIISAAIALVVIMTLSIIFLPSEQNKTKNTSPFLSVTPKPLYYSQTFTPSSQITVTNGTVKTSSQKTYATLTPASKPAKPTTIQSSAANPTQGTNHATSPVGISPTVSSAIAQSTQNTSGSSGGTQPASSAQNQIASSTSSPTPTNALPTTSQIIFIGSGGQQQIYTPPVDPPVDITWARYINSLEHYAIDYPSNWKVDKTQFRGHEAIFIYAPGEDPSNPNVQYISYGWTSYFYPPLSSYDGSFTLHGVLGTIYTNGSLGSTYIAGIFNYANGFLILNNNISDATFAYVFNHMILSLDFNIP